MRAILLMWLWAMILHRSPTAAVTLLHRAQMVEPGIKRCKQGARSCKKEELKSEKNQDLYPSRFSLGQESQKKIQKSHQRPWPWCWALKSKQRSNGLHQQISRKPRTMASDNAFAMLGCSWSHFIRAKERSANVKTMMPSELAEHPHCSGKQQWPMWGLRFQPTSSTLQAPTTFRVT